MSRNNGKTKKEQSHKVFLSKEFVSDLTRQNMLYAKIVRSPQKNIRISTFNLSILPENYYFFTSRDIPGKNVLETLETKSKIFAPFSFTFCTKSFLKLLPRMSWFS